MVNDSKTINEEKIYSAFKNATKLHLVLKNKNFRNGYVKEIGADFFIFYDDVNGAEPIFYLELYNIKPYMKEEKK